MDRRMQLRQCVGDRRSVVGRRTVRDSLQRHGAAGACRRGGHARAGRVTGAVEYSMPLKVKPRSVLLVLAALLAALGVARGGHELPVYPSYYPHEIAIETMPPERAADLFR